MELPVLNARPVGRVDLPPVPLPTFLQFEPVGQCNLRCQMCPIQFRVDGPPHGPSAFMAFETFTRLLEQFPSAQELQLQGLGEPLMHPRFFDMVAHAVGRALRVSTNTNLTYLNARRAEHCVRSGLHELHGSLDGATAATYEAIRPGARFQQVVDHLHQLLATRRRLDATNPWVRLVVVAMRQNLAEIPDLVCLAHAIGIDTVFVQHLCHDFGEASLPERYRPMRDFVDRQTLVTEDPARVEKYFEEARHTADRLGVDLRLPSTRPRPHPPGTRGLERCDWPWRGAYISYDGLAMPCCMVATPDRINFGKMGAHGVQAIWNSAAYQAFRKRLSSEDPPDVCRSCSVYRGTF
jgi:radical SAM protein with 4Fe4S-binding SPASM domain